MNRYSFLCEKLSQLLGDRFDIKFFENEQQAWEEILIDNAIHGVMHIVGGQSNNVGGEMAIYENLSISVMIPMGENDEDAEQFEADIVSIDILKHYNEVTLDNEGELITFFYGGKSGASRNPVNGKEYGLVIVNCAVISYNNIILSTDRTVKLNGSLLKGILNCNYQCNKNTDGDVTRNSPIQYNTVNGISDVIDIDIVWRNNDELHKQLMEEDHSIVEYEVEYFNGIITRTMTMQVSLLSEGTLQGDKLQGKLQFIRGKLK